MAERVRTRRRIARPIMGAALVLLLMLIAVSFRGYGLWNSSSNTPVYTMRVSRGLLTFKYFGDAKGALMFQPPLQEGWRFDRTENELNSIGWRWLPEWLNIPGPYSQFVLRIPLWIPAVLLAAPLVRTWIRSRRVVAQVPCEKCGYDLVGIEAERCPECGTVVSGGRKNTGHAEG